MKNPFKKADADAKSPKGGVRRKPTKITRASRFIFFIGDEGAILVHLKDGRVTHRHFAPDPQDPGVSTFREVLAADPKADVLMVVDTIDQSYVQHILPPVTVLSVNKLIKRRLERDFKADDIKGAVSLGREESGRKDWIFLLIALEKTPHLSAWIDMAIELPNRFLGITLVPVEAEIIVQQLELALKMTEIEEPSQWQFLVSHNKVGGFRQVILKNGRVIFTRLAQPAGDISASAVAGSIEQEILSTIEYMKRLSYIEKAGLNLYIIVSGDIKQAIDPQKFNATHVKVLTPHEAGQLLALEGATQPADQYGDVLLASGIGCARKHVMKMRTAVMEKLERIYNFLLLQKMVGGAFVVGVVLWSGMQAFEMSGIRSETTDLEQQKTDKTQDLKKLQIEAEQSPEKIEKINDMVDLYTLLKEESHSPTILLERVSAVLDADVRIRDIAWGSGEIMLSNMGRPGSGPPMGAGQGGSPPPSTPAPGVAAGGNAAGSDAINATLRVVFTSFTESNEEFVARANELLAKMQNAFKDYDVSYTKLPGITAENEQMSIALGTRPSPSMVQLDEPIETEMRMVPKPPEKDPAAVAASPAGKPAPKKKARP